MDAFSNFISMHFSFIKLIFSFVENLTVTSIYATNAIAGV